ncbi:uncharacterized protein LOC112494880 [Cephus cinctus]|uniref:Uncharacterized protein LOC112494880 n=1 Tax=Cephus cinctus TaxID=211228 RepID=A0AAJ7RPB6_CEPCN|nr:uncharacterized protein LOC112494880 [Cephus cinctus]
MTCDGMQVQGMHQEYNRRDVGLLHPDWRKFPHVQLYGWTAHHEHQWKYLHNMIVKGALESAYYATETQYKAASLSNQYTVLSRPIVSNVKEVIELLRRNQQFGNYSHSLAESAEYDADDESDDKPRLRCREKKYRWLETAV